MISATCSTTASLHCDLSVLEPPPDAFKPAVGWNQRNAEDLVRGPTRVYFGPRHTQMAGLQTINISSVYCARGV